LTKEEKKKCSQIKKQRLVREEKVGLANSWLLGVLLGAGVAGGAAKEKRGEGTEGRELLQKKRHQEPLCCVWGGSQENQAIGKRKEGGGEKHFDKSAMNRGVHWGAVGSRTLPLTL